MSKLAPRSEAETDRICALMVQELGLRDEAAAMSDGELARELTRVVWPTLTLYERPGVLVDEAITRLRRADIQRRWNERQARRRDA